MHVNSLRVLGSGTTRASFLNSVTSEIFKAQTLEEVVHSVQDAADKLRRHDIFSNIEVVLDAAEEATDAIDVVLKLQEKGRTIIKTNAEIADNEANVVCTISAVSYNDAGIHHQMQKMHKKKLIMFFNRTATLC